MTDKTIIEFLRESNAIECVYDYDSLERAKSAWVHLSQFDELTVKNILSVHYILMINHLRIKDRGKFRREEVIIAGRMGKAAWQVPSVMDGWILQANRDRTWDEIKRSHVLYEKIHPFTDGNGRTGRIFMNWQRVKNGWPILVIKESEKQEYYKWFRMLQKRLEVADAPQTNIVRSKPSEQPAG